MMSRRRPHRYTFGGVLAACWAIGLLGLDHGRVTALQITVVALTCSLVSILLAVRRRLIESARDRIVQVSAPEPPRNCIVLRPFGEAGDRTTWSEN
jgi:hypothetical protein